MTPTSDAVAPDARTLATLAREAVPFPELLPDREVLGRSACLALLAAGGHGRVAATRRAVPIIIPVSFTLLGEDLVFRPGPGDGLAQAVANSVVAFETDEVGFEGSRWEVHVTGVATNSAGDAEAPAFRLSSEVITGWRAN